MRLFPTKSFLVEIQPPPGPRITGYEQIDVNRTKPDWKVLMTELAFPLLNLFILGSFLAWSAVEYAKVRTDRRD